MVTPPPWTWAGRFLVALGQIQQHQQLRRSDLAVGQVRQRYLYFGDLRRVLSSGELCFPFRLGLSGRVRPVVGTYNVTPQPFFASIGRSMSCWISSLPRSVNRVNQNGINSLGMLMVLANCSLAGSPTPM